LSGILGVQFAETTELVQHRDGGDGTGKYYDWFIRDLGTTNQLRSKFIQLGEEVRSSFGAETSRQEIAVGMAVIQSDNAIAHFYTWIQSGVQFRVTLYSVDGSDWAKIMSFR
jgi:hypothetical protein